MVPDMRCLPCPQVEVRKAEADPWDMAMMFPKLTSPKLEDMAEALPAELRSKIDAFAEALAKKPEFESVAREKLAGKAPPNMAFLFGGDGSLYYNKLKEEKGIVTKELKKISEEELNGPPKPDGPDEEIGDQSS